MSNVTIMSVNMLKVNDYIVIQDKACRIIDIVNEEIDNHEAYKRHIKAIDIFTGRNQEIVHTSDEVVKSLIITRNDYRLTELISEEGQWGCRLSLNGKIRDDIKIPNSELGELIIDIFNDSGDVNVTIMEALGLKKIIGFKLK